MGEQENLEYVGSVHYLGLHIQTFCLKAKKRLYNILTSIAKLDGNVGRNGRFLNMWQTCQAAGRYSNIDNNKIGYLFR